MPQSDMKKASENASHAVGRTKVSDRNISLSAEPVAETKIESEISHRELTSASASASLGNLEQAAPQMSGLSHDATASGSSPEPPKVSSKRKSRNAASSLLRSNKNTAKPQPNLPASTPSVTQSSDLITIFIDGSNLFYAASHLNIEVDYRRLLTSLVRGRRLLRAYFYTGVDPQNEKQRGFLLWLNRHGHRVVSKELTNLPDGSRKANMHVEMAVDMMRISEYCPNITLLGGDGNLAYALQVLSQRGIFIEVVSLQSMTSDSLIDLADSYTDLADLRDEIKR